MADHSDPKPPETKNTCLYLHDYTILGRRDIIFDRKGLTEMSVMVFFLGGGCKCPVIAKFHYTGPTGPDQTKSADFVGDPSLRPGSREKVRAGPVGPV